MNPSAKRTLGQPRVRAVADGRAANGSGSPILEVAGADSRGSVRLRAVSTRGLSRAVIATVVLALGAAAEVVAPSSSPALTAADFAVGSSLALGGVWLAARAPGPALVAIVLAVTWFLGTLAGASNGLLSGVGSVCLLAYRGPLLQLLLGIPAGRIAGWHLRVVGVACWIAAVLPIDAARPSTACTAALVAAALASRSRHAAADRKRVLLAAAAAAAILTAVWTLAITATSDPDTLLLLDDLAVLGAGVLALSAAAGAWAHHAASAIVVELGPGAHPGQPVGAQLARVLADPALVVLYQVPGFGWVDEQGRASNSPNGDRRAVTRASAPGGGEVALIHGTGRASDPRLAQAAAAAAALVLDVARLEAEVRARAGEVRASRRRLLTVADAERRSLETRLTDDVLAPLRRIERLLAPRPDSTAILAELHDAMTEVAALGRGLYPPALVRADLAAALEDLARRCPAHTTIDVVGNVQRAPDQLREAAWFVCSEALANVARHADASHVTVRAVADSSTLVVEIGDDGRGGATIARGLRGLADRVEALGGTLVLESPPGGPTVIRAELPL